MCIIIDTCSFSSVFDSQAVDHCEFKPLLKWLTQGRGKIVYGGSKYKSELRKAHKYFRFFAEFKRAGKLVEVNCDDVDCHEKNVISCVADTSCDDPHLIAIVIVSGCCLICSADKRSYKFVKQTNLYPKGVSKPKLYTKSKNANLLTDKYIVKVCCPKLSGSRDLGKLFESKTQQG